MENIFAARNMKIMDCLTFLIGSQVYNCDKTRLFMSRRVARGCYDSMGCIAHIPRAIPCYFDVLERSEYKFYDYKFTFACRVNEDPHIPVDNPFMQNSNASLIQHTIAYIRIHVTDVELEPRIKNGNTKGYEITGFSIFTGDPKNPVLNNDLTFRDALDKMDKYAIYGNIANELADNCMRAIDNEMGKFIEHPCYDKHCTCINERRPYNYANTLMRCGKYMQEIASLINNMIESYDEDALYEQQMEIEKHFSNS